MLKKLELRRQAIEQIKNLQGNDEAVDFALLIDDPSLAKKRREEINQKNEAKRRELRRNVLGMLEVTNVKDKEEIYIHDDEIEP